tara:strand:+ start:1859 stop:2008 length:150 start_codon:yes stop_codon:yes gene_type:complete
MDSEKTRHDGQRNDRKYDRQAEYYGHMTGSETLTGAGFIQFFHRLFLYF